jgi:hypothetical protein
VGVILLWVWVFPRESQNPILVAQLLLQCCRQSLRPANGTLVQTSQLSRRDV